MRGRGSPWRLKASGALAPLLVFVLAAVPAGASNPPSISVSGNQLVAGGQPVQLRGADYTYLLGDCEYGDPDPEDADSGPGTVGGHTYYGTTEGLAGTIANMRAWGANAVRLVVNVHCWLGDVDPSYGSAKQPVNGAGTTYTATTGLAAADEGTYERTVIQDIGQFNAAGLYVILDPYGVDYMPDPDYVEFWQEAAKALSSNHDVLFDPYNEIALSQGYNGDTFTNAAGTSQENPWTCWQKGCYAYTASGVSTGVAASHIYKAPGMQDLIDAIRGSGDSLQPTNGTWPDDAGFSTGEAWSEQPDPATGATSQPITLGGLDYDSSFGSWLSDLPTDPGGAIVLDTHRYDFVEPGVGSPLRTAPGAGDDGDNAPDNDPGGPGDGAGDGSFDTFLADTVVPLAQQVPVVFGELGELYCDSSQELDPSNPNPDYVANALAQLDSANRGDGVLIGAIGYEWRAANHPYFGCPTADPPGANNGTGYGGPLMLANSTGAPTGSEGAALESWMQAGGSNGGSTTTTTTTPTTTTRSTTTTTTTTTSTTTSTATSTTTSTLPSSTTSTTTRSAPPPNHKHKHKKRRRPSCSRRSAHHRRGRAHHGCARHRRHRHHRR
jgi:hypothetical protein